MRPIFFIIIISLFFLTACGAAAPQVTVTSEVTVTLTPAATFTATPTATFTPTPAFSPEVDGIIADETTLPEVAAFLTAAKAGGFAAEVTADGKINIPGVIEINQITGKTERTYPFTLPDGKVIQLTTSGQVGVDVTIGMDANGNTVMKTEGWKYDQKTGWTRAKALMPDGITETEYPAYSKMEVMATMLADTLKIENPNWQDENSPERKEGGGRVNRLLGFSGTPRVLYEGMSFQYKSGKSVGDSRFYFIAENGEPVIDVPGKVLEIPMPYFGYVGLQGGQSLVAREKYDGEKVEIMLDAELGDMSYYNQHGVTPFSLTQAEYDAIMSALTPAN